MRWPLWIHPAHRPVGLSAMLAAAGILAGGLCGCDSGDGCSCGPLVDTVAPTAVTTLAVTAGQPCSGYLTLTWTATGDDGATGTAELYDLRYNQTGFVTAQDWTQATAFTELPAPRAAGAAETLEVRGLTVGLTYHFALMVGDDAGNWSGRSNAVSAELCAPDTIPPAAVTTLSVDPLVPSPTSLRLLWTAVGDDSLTGTAAGYDLRYNTTGIANQDDWEAATQVTGESTPGAAGAPESLTVAGLEPETLYYFALVVSDDAGLTSARSNVASGSSSAPARWRVDPGGGGDFTRIQPAIDAAADHDTITVAAGVYSDTLRIEGKILHLLGAGADLCVVAHPTQDECVLTLVNAPGVFIKGIAFTQQHTMCGNGVRIEASHVRFEACALCHCGLTSEQSETELLGCTIDGQCSMDCDMLVPFVELEGGGAQFEACILTTETGGYDQLWCGESTEVSFKCCDILVSLVGCPDPLGTDGNFALDPMYVDAAAGDFHLLGGSPCLSESSPSGCGLVGVFGTVE